MRTIPQVVNIEVQIITAIPEISSTDHSRNKTTDKRIMSNKFFPLIPDISLYLFQINGITSAVISYSHTNQSNPIIKGIDLP